MLATAVKFLGGLLSKELLVSIFKEVVIDFAMDLLKEFVESTENKYDDQLVAKFQEFLDNRE